MTPEKLISSLFVAEIFSLLGTKAKGKGSKSVRRFGDGIDILSMSPNSGVAHEVSLDTGGSRHV